MKKLLYSECIFLMDRFVPEGMSQVWRRLDVGNHGIVNGALSTPGYLLALLRELSQVSRGLADIAEGQQVRKTNRIGILYQIKKKGFENRSSRFEPKIG